MFEHLTSPMAFKLLGLTISVLVVFLAFLSCVGALSRMRYAARQAKLDLKEFQVRIEGARVAVEQQREQVSLSWQGYRKFVVKRKVPENNAEDICSFYLSPHDGRPLPEFQPGQFLTFRLDVPGQKKPVVRCYSLSDAHNPAYYRVSIKRLLGRPDKSGTKAPDGLASNFFHDSVKEGDILDVKAPAGKFALDTTRGFPVVLVAGGVGITPMLSMYQSLARLQPNRPVSLFYGVRHSDEVVMGQRLVELAQSSPNCHVHFCYSDPNERDQGYCARTEQALRAAASTGGGLPPVAHSSDRVSVELMRRMLPGESARDTHQFFICGPGPMLMSVTKALEEWGVPESHVHYEAFGPSTVKKAPRTSMMVPTQQFQVTFSKAGKTLTWTPEHGSLLELAESEGVAIDSGCRAGDCHSCKVALKTGEVVYLKDPPDTPEAGTALLCVAVPKCDLTVDA